MPTKDKTLRFPPSDSNDVVGYRLYIQESPDPVTFNSESIDLQSPPVENGYISIKLNDLEAISTKDGTYNLGVIAIDDAGNESSMSKLDNVPLDFLPPNPPGALEIL